MPRPRIIVQSPASATGWWRAPEPEKLCIADRLEEVMPVLNEIEAWADDGGWATGYLAYEAGPAFDPALEVHPGSTGPDGLPLAWFALGAGPMEVAPPTPLDLAPIEWTGLVPRPDYLRKLAAIRREIERGNTYQVNFTLPLRADAPPDPDRWFAAARSGHPRACQALLHIPGIRNRGPWSVVCLSPELFFGLHGEEIWSRPMKGTADPGRDLAETRYRAQLLAESEKDRAENVMIVDMVRNDLGRIAHPGTVRVPELFEIEHHPTVLQMTSTVRAVTDASLPEIFAALFPCASITGAPKIATSRIIAELEVQPRGLYTGAIGWIGPGRRARFGVAIRTAVIDHRLDLAEYGVGSGVVWDSDPEEEFRECLTKAAIVSRPQPRFDLLETMLWEPSRGLVLREPHRRRLERSAQYLAIPVQRGEPDDVFSRLHEADPGGRPQRIRLTLAMDGKFEWHREELDPLPDPYRVCFAELEADIDDTRLWHKTTARELHERALRAHPSVDDVLLVNPDGEVTESTIANLVFNLDGNWLTPRREAGLLDGTLRADLLAGGLVGETEVTPQMVGEADLVFLVNSLRGWWPVRLVADQP